MHNGMTQMGVIMRNAREAKEMTQAALAEKVDVSVRTIIAVEKNQRNPTYEVFSRLVHALDISTDTIFFPGHSRQSPEQNQFLHEFLSCDEWEQKIIMSTLRTLIRELRQVTQKKQC